MVVATRVLEPQAEHHREPLGIGEASPRLSFVVTDAPPGWRQTGYEIEVRRDDGLRATFDISGADTVLVPWPDAPLSSRESAAVRVRVRGEGSPGYSDWSPVTNLEAGLLAASDWTASFVAPDWVVDPRVEQIPPLLRGEFRLSGDVVRARLYATSHGLYALELNGQRVGDHVMAPGWTSYHHRLRYQTYDVTALVRAGENCLGAQLAEGWYAGRLGFYGGRRGIWGTRLALKAQVEVVYADGRREMFGTGPGWQAGTGGLRRSGIYDGEAYDASAAPGGWSSPGFAATGWSGVEVLDDDGPQLVAADGPPVRCTQELSVDHVLAADDGAVILDFGQNLVGRCRITVDGPAGAVVRLRHAEVLQDGQLYVRPLRSARATDEYVLAGGGPETWEPQFTFHGFRYVEVTGWPGELDPAAVVARVLHSDLRRTGWFRCSDPLVQQLHDNVVWSMRGNFLDIPTDCPQRDERLGWTGDIQVFAPTASYLFDCSGMLTSWLRDVAAEQQADGTVPYFVPRIPSPKWEPPQPTAVWGDVCVLTPWTLFERFGDRAILERQYDSAVAYLELVARRAGPDHLWDEGFQLGDWLDPAAPPDDPFDARADRYLVATAYFAHSAEVLGRIAATLERSDDATRYYRLARRVADAFRARWLSEGGRLADDAPTSYALALAFGLVPEGPQRSAAASRLAELVIRAGGRIATGFAGTPAICSALSENGQLDAAYLLLTCTECPSWLYPVTRGATTIWERWDSLLPDGTVNPGQMTSFNHYALGAVADWLHGTVAGLAPLEPGWRRFAVRPRPGGGLRWAKAALDSPYGRAEVGWELRDERLVVDALVPVGATALVDLPGRPVAKVGHGAHSFEVPWAGDGSGAA
jgi:alpha-L-rhamnosidase